jgi:hypothetical protein
MLGGSHLARVFGESLHIAGVCASALHGIGSDGAEGIVLSMTPVARERRGTKETTMGMKHIIYVGLVAAMMAFMSAAPTAQAAESGVKVGVLTCNVSSGWGFVVGSSKDVNCVFAPADAHAKRERYTGKISKFGADIGYSSAGVMVWAVLAPATNMKSGALAGQYAGVTGGAAVGVGANAHVLVGGLDKSISLQPVSIEGESGLNVAAGVEALTLTHAR